MAEHNRLGKWGEEEVIAHLVKNGYAIVEHNWRMNHLEIDIIASKGRDIVFVEVKTRREKGSRPEDAINARKISTMRNTDTPLMKSNIATERGDDVAEDRYDWKIDRGRRGISLQSL